MKKRSRKRIEAPKPSTILMKENECKKKKKMNEGEWKAKLQWLKLGDDNTAFFHHSINHRVRSNIINFLHMNGEDYDPDRIQQGKLLDLTFSDDGIKNALWSIPDEKALGLDGFNSKFYKASWSIVGNDVISAIKVFFLTGKMLKSRNTTTITLIPKVQCPSYPRDFRTISCCHAQGAFVAARNIMHNISLCQDLVRHYTRKNCAPSCLMKIDLCKAYDTMSWQFIKEVLVVLNFPHTFIKIIMMCITSTSYVLMLNGTPTPVFSVKRSPQQEDPLSPLLFVIGMKYMSRILRNAEGTFDFHPRCKTIKFSHLCFADDVMLFSKLAIYTAGIPTDIWEEIRTTSQFTYGSLPFKYLGVPLSSKRLSIVHFEQIPDKMTWRIRAWSAKNLSYAARLQLINSVLMGISTYWCQMFILPRRVLRLLISFVVPFYGLVCMIHKNLSIWVHGVYTKGDRWEIFNAPITASWTLKKIFGVKDLLLTWIGFQFQRLVLSVGWLLLRSLRQRTN
ncbi:uncharacterized protein LOC130810803 [Amaranthus tricolor]|uniref:uncharacterized protein LOC130810803 n=1 Tax=Amaranthus tricolor TaxID=29722 RepID=UPI00258DFAB6|nr:uncharacterized protein LOC130810803 [Amaranthus tricolor]